MHTNPRLSEKFQSESKPMKEVLLKVLDVIDANFWMFTLLVITIFGIIFESFSK
jgi:type II secretory pathway component PulF